MLFLQRIWPDIRVILSICEGIFSPVVNDICWICSPAHMNIQSSTLNIQSRTLNIQSCTLNIQSCTMNMQSRSNEYPLRLAGIIDTLTMIRCIFAFSRNSHKKFAPEAWEAFLHTATKTSLHLKINLYFWKIPTSNNIAPVVLDFNNNAFGKEKYIVWVCNLI
jgi:hypothetical protein